MSSCKGSIREESTSKRRREYQWEKQHCNGISGRNMTGQE